MIRIHAVSFFVFASGAAAQSFDVQRLGYDKGNPAATIAIIEFGDFGCSACAVFFRDTYPQLHREFIATGRVKWKYVPFILGSFPNSGAATKAAECAADQDAFWSMHDLLYQKQREWNKLLRPAETMQKFAAELGLDRARFRECYDKDVTAARTRQANDIARELMVRATPTFFINGRRAVGALTIDQWRLLLAN
jgi:protein-disulfide isomerase